MRGITHGAVRWKTCSRPTSGWIAGTNWIAEAPVPITATRRPRRSWPWSQRAEWNIVPANVSSPGISGWRGSLSGPWPAMRNRARTVPEDVASTHRPVSSSHVADSTAVRRRIERRRSCSSARRCR